MTVQLSEAEIATVNQILARHLGDMDCRIFGSRAKGTAKKYSDLDIAVVGSEPIPLLTLSNLEESFSESDLPFKVDIVDWQRITNEFQEKIKTEWVKLKA
jgi:type I restriction enzyme, S subunit